MSLLSTRVKEHLRGPIFRIPLVIRKTPKVCQRRVLVLLVVFCVEAAR